MGRCDLPNWKIKQSEARRADVLENTKIVFHQTESQSHRCPNIPNLLRFLQRNLLLIILWLCKKIRSWHHEIKQKAIAQSSSGRQQRLRSRKFFFGNLNVFTQKWKSKRFYET